MSLREFMKTDIFKDAGYVEYIGSDGMELEYDDCLLDVEVVNWHKYSSGCLEIKLEAI